MEDPLASGLTRRRMRRFRYYYLLCGLGGTAGRYSVASSLGFERQGMINLFLHRSQMRSSKLVESFSRQGAAFISCVVAQRCKIAVRRISRLYPYIALE